MRIATSPSKRAPKPSLRRLPPGSEPDRAKSAICRRWWMTSWSRCSFACRLTTHEPASLVRATLVCRRWRCLVSDPGSRRRFREFHRRPPMLGMLCNRDDVHMARFMPTAAFCSPEADRGHWRALDARHGRVLVVWDPITDEERVLPFPPHYTCTLAWTAVVLCAAAAPAAGACDHLDCHRRPFVVVFVGSVFKSSDAGKTFVSTYASETAAWTEPIYTGQPGYRVACMGSALVGNALYFVEFLGRRVLKYNLELHEMSWILLPSSSHGRQSVLITTENGQLGLAIEHESKLYIWLRKQDACKVGDEWQKPSRAIKLKTLLPADAALSKLDVVGSVEGVGIIFMRADDVVLI